MINAKKSNIIERPPVVAIMGHIDHGKSTLLDFIRTSNIVEKEAGGITQHTSAYVVSYTTKEKKTKWITFLDTPGHAAFSKMRIRGANVADIAILVVSAEDGVKPQTIEALDSIKIADIPYIIAINKIDKPGADINKTKSSLLEHEIYIEGSGGNISCVEISAKTGEGIPNLLEILLLTAEMDELTGDTEKNAEGVVIEANVDSQKGISAVLVIKEGSLKKGMFVASGNVFVPVRICEDFLGKIINEATFSSPITLSGWNKIPEVGEVFKSFETRKEAEEYTLQYEQEKQKSAKDVAGKVVKIEITNKTEEAEEVEKFCIPILVKADVSGTLDAVLKEISKIDLPNTILQVIYTGVGTITENDVKHAIGSKDVIVLGFNINIDPQANMVAEQCGVHIKTFDIIYKMTEWLEKEARLKTPDIEVEKMTGRLKILRLFSKKGTCQIIGGKVLEGSITMGATVRILRRDNLISAGKILELQTQKNKTSEVKEGEELGAKIESKIDLAVDDTLESFIMTAQ
ncbi:translation initiation factor IF-2 [Patescibacteria group bacterium]|nr:translation initiation factor IF-2 [Patescibacteria group bacterium]